jgi:hypothetical protein
MSRIVSLLLIAAVGLFTSRGIASTTCQQTVNGSLCISQVDFQQFAQQAYMSQQSSQWCWAASISMLFSFYGHPVSQSRIVTEAYGVLANVPAQGNIIAGQLNRSWVDDSGEGFASRLTGAYDAQAGINSLTNQQIINELDQNHPMVIGARTHAMVLTAIQYYQTTVGPNVVAAGVFDPWPGQGARGLEMDELYPREVGGSLLFAATVRVTDAPTSGVGGGPSGSGGKGSGSTGSGSNGSGSTGSGSNGSGSNGSGSNGSGSNGSGSNGSGSNGSGSNGSGATGSGSNGSGSTGPGFIGPSNQETDDSTEGGCALSPVRHESHKSFIFGAGLLGISLRVLARLRRRPASRAGA